MEPKIAEKYLEIPLSSLRFAARKKLSLYLNPDGQITAHVQYENNFRGLAELAGFTYQEIRNCERLKNPTEELLEEWTDRPDLSPTIGNLWSLLSNLERVDVLTECRSLIERDCEIYIQRKAKFDPPIQEDTVSNSTDVVSCDQIYCAPLTRHDVKYGGPTIYDAFVCYNDRGPDQDFVLLIISKLERERGLKLFIPQRDDLAGTEQNKTSATLIEDRCKKMLVVLSPRFLNSAACEFQVQFANSLDAGTRHKKIIPVLIEECDKLDIPHVLRHITVCDYTRLSLRDWFWERLYMSLRAPLGPTCKNDKLCNILALRNRVCQAYYWKTVERIRYQDCNPDFQKKMSSITGLHQTSTTSMPSLTCPPQTNATSMTMPLPLTMEPPPATIHDKVLEENFRNDKAAETSISNTTQPQYPSSQDCNNDSAVSNIELETSRVIYRRPGSCSQYPSSEPGTCIENRSTSNIELETIHVVYKSTGSPSPQVPSAENRVPKPPQHSYLPKKRFISPPERCDTEPSIKALHHSEPDRRTEGECSQSLKTPVEHDESCG